MPLVGIFKGKEKNYLFSDNCIYTGSCNFEAIAPRQFKIQKFKNFVVAYRGEPDQFFRFVKEVDFDNFPEPVTKSYLMRNFYSKYLDFCCNYCNPKLSRGAITDCEFQISIMGKDYLFDICTDYCYEVTSMHGYGNDRILFQMYETLKDRLSDDQLIRVSIEQSAKRLEEASFPYLLVDNSDLDHAKLIYKDGSTKTIELIEHWRKK